MTSQISGGVLVEAVLPPLSRTQNFLLIVSGSLLVALCAQVSLPLPFSPVPVTGQTFAVLLLGATFGARRSAAALLLYLAEGATGLPVFAPGGVPGMARLLGPTGGYLLAFPLAAFLLGWLVERADSPGVRRSVRGWLAAVLAAEAVIFAAGVLWLKLIVPLGWAEAAWAGLVPFLPGELLKVALLGVCLPASWWALDRARGRPR